MNVYLAQTYESLTAGKTDAWSNFSSLLEASFPSVVLQGYRRQRLSLLTARPRLTAKRSQTAVYPAAAAWRAEYVPEKSLEPK